MDRTRIWFIGILLVAVVITGYVSFQYGNSRPFDGEFDNAGLFNVKGQILEAKSFQAGENFKFLVAVEAVEVTQLGEGDVVTGLPIVGDTVAVDVEDSRFNLFVSQDNIVCHEDGVKICVYEVTHSDVSMTVREVLGSSGLPEFSGTPK